MSAAEIIDELPNLSATDVRLVRQRLIELAAQNNGVPSAIKPLWKVRCCSTLWGQRMPLVNQIPR